MSSNLEHVVITHPDDDHADGDATVRRAPRISQEDVFRSADALLVEGHRPTIDRVRMRLGRGSPNTINDHLDAWWARLGSRLRDLPDRQFPQLPERVAASLQQLWNEALEGAHEALRASIEAREAAWTEREQQLARRAAELAEQERVAQGRTAALDENLTLARTQLTEANRRATVLEETLRERDADLSRLRARLDKFEHDHAELAQRLDSERAAHLTERGRLEERYAATEARWLTEVDRTRQGLKGAERHGKELQAQVGQLHAEREHARMELANLRAELNTALAVRTQLEERIRLLSRAPAATPRKTPRPRPAVRAGRARRTSASRKTP